MIGAKTGDNRVRKLLDQLELKYEIDNEGDLSVVFGVGEDRSQVVHIDSHTRYVDRLEIRGVWSMGLRSEAPLHADIANALLVYNASVDLGAWQLVRDSDSGVDGEGCFAAFMVFVAADITAQSLLSVMHAVGSAADEIEEKIAGEDRF